MTEISGWWIDEFPVAVHEETYRLVTARSKGWAWFDLIARDAAKQWWDEWSTAHSLTSTAT